MCISKTGEEKRLVSYQLTKNEEFLLGLLLPTYASIMHLGTCYVKQMCSPIKVDMNTHLFPDEHVLGVIVLEQEHYCLNYPR